jgi:hypothetical protein
MVRNKNQKETMKKIQLAITAGVIGLAMSTFPAHANLIEGFSYVDTATDGSVISASGTLTLNDTLITLTGNIDGYNVTGLQGYDIIGITGQINGAPITGLVDNPNFPGASGNFAALYDNAFLQPPGFDILGLLFTDNGGNEINLYSVGNPSGGGYLEQVNGGSGTPVTLTLTAIPEASTMVAGALLLLPFGASTLRVLRRRQTA